MLLDIAMMPDLVSIKVGTFDDPTWFSPQMDIWTGSAQGWMPLDANRPGFEGNPGR